jgi:hypothetical protein
MGEMEELGEAEMGEMEELREAEMEELGELGEPEEGHQEAVNAVAELREAGRQQAVDGGATSARFT